MTSNGNTVSEEDVVPLVGAKASGDAAKKTNASSSTAQPSFQRKWIVPLIIIGVAAGFFFLYENKNDEVLPEKVVDKIKDGEQTVPTNSDLNKKPKKDNRGKQTAPKTKPAPQPKPAPATSPKEQPDAKPATETKPEVKPETGSEHAQPETTPKSDPPVLPSPSKKEDAGKEEDTGKKEDTPVTIDPSLAQTDVMIQKFKQARGKLIEKLKKDYGEDAFHQMFEVDSDGGTVSRGRTIYSPGNGPGGPSWDRMKRKIMMKLLQVQVVAKKSRRRRLGDGESDIPAIPFVWASGGHSAAAGHGNFYNESYTAVMTNHLSPIFGAVGMNFQGRNYAMGGTSSAPEVASCVSEVFGLDVDVLSWDYGMTDGRDMSRMTHFFYRAGVHPNRPACVAIHTAGVGGRINVVKDFEDRGLAAFHCDDTVRKAVTAAAPDMMGLEQAEIDQIPPFVRYYRCSNNVEKGDPGCGDNKFNDAICEKRKFKVSWHPGWKDHALDGNLISLFLSEVLDDALQQLTNASDPQSLLDQLKADEDADYDKFMKAELPQSAVNYIQEEARNEIDVKDILLGPSHCHTARLPAEARHLGILTESSQVGFDSYDRGMERRDADQTPNESGMMRLIYEKGERQLCQVPVQMDYKDFWYIKPEEGWVKLRLPNDAEAKTYGAGPFKGLVAICFVGCAWGRCPGGDVRPEDITAGKMAEIHVNGQPIVNMTTFNINECVFLKGEQGHLWPADSDGRYEVKAKVTDEASYLRFSTFLIW